MAKTGPLFAYLRSPDKRREVRVFISGVITVRYKKSPWLWSDWRRITMVISVTEAKRSYEKLGWVENPRNGEVST